MKSDVNVETLFRSHRKDRMSQDQLKMLERAKEQLAATASVLESTVMDLVTSRLQFIDQWSPCSALDQVQKLHRELELFKEDLDKEVSEASV